MTRQRINRISVLLLVLGLGSALIIFLAAGPEQDDPNDPLATKKYRREMQVIGGKANLVADDFQNWFAGLWQGRALAGTVVVLTVGATLAFRFIALPPPAGESRR